MEESDLPPRVVGKGTYKKGRISNGVLRFREK